MSPKQPKSIHEISGESENNSSDSHLITKRSNRLWPELSPLSKEGRLGWVSCFATGILTFMSFPNAWSPDLNLFWMMWFSHVPLMLFLWGRTPKSGALWGFICGFIINTGGYYWIGELIITFGQLPMPIAGLGLCLHSALVGLIWGIWGGLICFLCPKWDIRWIAPIAMVVAEHFMPRIFPAYMGNCQYPWIEIMQIADLLGVSAVTFLLYRINAEIFIWLKQWKGQPVIHDAKKGKIGLWVTLSMMLLSIIYGVIRIQQIDTMSTNAPKIKVGVVEADVGIALTETREKLRNNLLTLQNLSADLVHRGAELIIWSESAYRASRFPVDLPRVKPSNRPLVDHWKKDQKTPRFDRITPLRGFKAPLLLGATAIDPKEKNYRKVYNSAWLLDQEGVVQGRYDKIYRLVFGEYIPFGDTFPIFYKWLPSASRLEQGEKIEPLILKRENQQIRIGVLICYEGILPEFSRELLKTDPDVLVNITNDAWFGLSAERYLHFALALPRAIESRRGFIRGTLTGVSAYVDPVGRIVSWTKPKDKETLLEEVPLMRPWTLYQVIGDLFPKILLLVLFILIVKQYSLNQQQTAT